MEIHQLRYFCAVARNGTFTRAAEVEHVAQPSLSQQIMKLETELGARLFDRLPRCAKLTVFGNAFLPKAERILRELGEAKTEVLEMVGQEKGDVVLGVIPTVAPYLLPHLLNGFAQRHPAVTVRVMEHTTTVLVEGLRQGAIDMAVVALPISGDEMSCVELFEEPMFAVLPGAHPRAHQTTIKLSDLKSEPFLLLKEGHCFRDSTIDACREARFRPKVIFESGQFATILAMVSVGMGVSAVPAMAVQPASGCCFIRIAGNRSVRKIGIIALRQHYKTRAAEVLLQHATKTAGALPPG
jgi:LysR family transcriptional regulator, hydrogen peroxide-inducible genes activator